MTYPPTRVLEGLRLDVSRNGKAFSRRYATIEAHRGPIVGAFASAFPKALGGVVDYVEDTLRQPGWASQGFEGLARGFAAPRSPLSDDPYALIVRLRLVDWLRNASQLFGARYMEDIRHHRWSIGVPEVIWMDDGTDGPNQLRMTLLSRHPEAECRSDEELRDQSRTADLGELPGWLTLLGLRGLSFEQPG